MDRHFCVQLILDDGGALGSDIEWNVKTTLDAADYGFYSGSGAILLIRVCLLMALFSLSELWRMPTRSLATRASNLVRILLGESSYCGVNILQLTVIERDFAYSSWAATACRGRGDAVLDVF